MVRFAARMWQTEPLQWIAVRRAVSHATTVIINPATLVSLMNVQTVPNNAMSEFHRRVQAAYGRAVQSVRQIRSAVAEAAFRVVQTRP